MTKWLNAMFPHENGSCEGGKLRYYDSYLKNNEGNFGNDDQQGRPPYSDRNIRSVFYQVIKL